MHHFLFPFPEIKSCFSKMFIYTENDIVSNKRFKATIHNTKHTKYTNTFSKNQLVQNPYVQKLDIHSNQRFPLILMARLETSF